MLSILGDLDTHFHQHLCYFMVIYFFFINAIVREKKNVNLAKETDKKETKICSNS